MWRDKDNNVSWFIVYSIFFYSFFIKILFSRLIHIMDCYNNINSINQKDAIDPWIQRDEFLVSNRRVSWLVCKTILQQNKREFINYLPNNTLSTDTPCNKSCVPYWYLKLSVSKLDFCKFHFLIHFYYWFNLIFSIIFKHTPFKFIF